MYTYHMTDVTYHMTDVLYTYRPPGLLVMVALGSLTPYFRYIPTATLSSVIICAVVFMVDWRIVPDLWRCRSEYCGSAGHVAVPE